MEGINKEKYHQQEMVLLRYTEDQNLENLMFGVIIPESSKIQLLVMIVLNSNFSEPCRTLHYWTNARSKKGIQRKKYPQANKLATWFHIIVCKQIL